jgi:hypothetical protein
MAYTYERYTADDFKEVENIFFKVFGHNQDLDSINLRQKLDTSYTSTSDIMVLARTEDGSLAGALGIYPVLMTYGERVIKAGQIGDAMVYSEHRGKGLFSDMISKLIAISSEEGIDLIYTLPSIHNKGSYKGFQKNKFEEVDSLYSYSLSTKASLLPRLLRKINTKIYESYCSSLLKKCTFQKAFNNSNQRDQFLEVLRDEQYLNYKKFNSNDLYEFKTAYAWLNIGKFDIKLGYYQLKPNVNFDDFLVELSKTSAKLGKDNIVLLQNENYSNRFQNFSAKKFQIKNDVRLMVYFINEDLRNLEFSINFADSDTF